MKIKNKINISFITAFGVILISVGLITGLYATRLIKNNIYLYLESDSHIRAEHIRTFIGEQKKTATILAAASIYQDFLKEPLGSEQYKIIKDKINNRLARTMQADQEIYEVLILNINGITMASSNLESEGEDESKDEYFLEGKNGVFIKDVYWVDKGEGDGKELTYAISAPIKDDSGNLLGVSLLRYKPDYFYKIVKSENILGKTEENFLINKNKFFITPSLFLGKEVVLKQKVETKNANDCFDPKEIEYVSQNGYFNVDKVKGLQIVEAQDYRNISVIATHAYIPETGWCLITKVDKSDIFSFRNNFIIIFLTIFIFAGLIFSIIGRLISRKITKPIETLEKGIEKIKESYFDYKVEIITKDEIGKLSKAFNTMTGVVKQSRAEIEMKVKEQTEEIEEKARELEDQKKAILNVLEDVEKEKSKTELLAKDLEKFKLAVDNASDQVIITDPEGIVIYGNRAVEVITGFKPEEALGKKAGSLWKTPMLKDYYEKLWDTIKNKKEVFISEILNKRKNGQSYIANISISPVLDTNNEVLYFVAIEHDITKEKEIDKAKTEFVSLASHQLRTPLSSINWYTEMLLAGDAGDINEEQTKYLNEVAIGNKRMISLVDSLLNVSRLDLGTFIVELENVDVIEMAKSVISEMRSQITMKNIKIEESYGDGVKNFNADKKLLRMVMQNLLSNAVKYTSQEGKVELNIKYVKGGETFGEKIMIGDYLTFIVSDSGIGIPINQQNKMFSKLFRADNARESETEGTGLGLYIIKSIIDQSGGNVWFKSEEKKGTTFYVIFPIDGMKNKDDIKK